MQKLCWCVGEKNHKNNMWLMNTVTHCILKVYESKNRAWKDMFNWVVTFIMNLDLIGS